MAGSGILKTRNGDDFNITKKGSEYHDALKNVRLAYLNIIFALGLEIV